MEPQSQPQPLESIYSSPDALGLNHDQNSPANSDLEEYPNIPEFLTVICEITAVLLANGYTYAACERVFHKLIYRGLVDEIKCENLGIQLRGFIQKQRRLGLTLAAALILAHDLVTYEIAQLKLKKLQAMVTAASEYPQPAPRT